MVNTAAGWSCCFPHRSCDRAVAKSGTVHYRVTVTKLRRNVRPPCTSYIFHANSKTNQSPGTSQDSGGFSRTPDWIRTSDLQSRSSCRKSVYALKTRGVGNCADCFEVISDACQTIPIPISTSSATMTTSAEIMKPWIMGRMPAFFMLAKEVFRPMAASAQTIRNLLAVLVPLTT